ncbi:DNA polymerase III subunit epsilon [Serratia symbiotica]|nr:DNA polymerase III subunit epsilon [Serratia symbiotica]
MNLKINRQIVLDTETTGINKFGVHYKNHRIIEIGAVELINRRLTGNYYHTYIKPNCLIDIEAYNIHGISDSFLVNKPTFNEIFNNFLNFINNSELIIHNAPFDVGFINQEFYFLEQEIENINISHSIIDTLLIARKLFPGKRNNLDALCKRYQIDNSKRTVHSALLDAEILAKVYLAMTGGQTSMVFYMKNEIKKNSSLKIIQKILPINIQKKTKIIYANDKELLMHTLYLDSIIKQNKKCLWYELIKNN